MFLEGRKYCRIIWSLGEYNEIISNKIVAKASLSLETVPGAVLSI
jgi:hypothetical protein